jgi:hypothetical protein
MIRCPLCRRRRRARTLGLGRPLDEMGRQALHPGPVVSDLRTPEMINPVAVLNRRHGAPAVHPDRPVGERNRGELDAHPVHLCHERLDIERIHIPTPLLRNTSAGQHCRRCALALRSRDQNQAPSRIALPHTQLYLSAPRDESTYSPAYPALYAPPVTQRPQISRRPTMPVAESQPLIESRHSSLHLGNTGNPASDRYALADEGVGQARLREGS